LAEWRIPEAAEADFVARAADAGLGIYPITPLYGHARRPGCAGLVVGYAALTVTTIEKEVELLAGLIRSHEQG
jgi:GntR family transcriptional regulator / MocR family aminotransferase